MAQRRRSSTEMTGMMGGVPMIGAYTVVRDVWIFGQLIEAGPVALNLFSRGAPIGRPVPTPEVLKNRPLKPPGR